MNNFRNPTHKEAGEALIILDIIEREDKEENTSQLMRDHDIDEDTAERVQELIDEGLDEDDALMVAEEM